MNKTKRVLSVVLAVLMLSSLIAALDSGWSTYRYHQLCFREW